MKFKSAISAATACAILTVSGMASAAPVVQNVSVTGVGINLNGIVLNLNEVISGMASATKSVVKSAVSKNAYTTARIQIRDDFEAMSQYVRNVRTAYRQTSDASVKQAILVKSSTEIVNYCEGQKKLEAALWKAYTKDNASRFPTGLEKPGLVFTGKNCRDYAARTLKNSVLK